MKLILTAEVDHLVPPATPSRSRTGTDATTFCRAGWPFPPRAVPRSKPMTSGGA